VEKTIAVKQYSYFDLIYWNHHPEHYLKILNCSKIKEYWAV
jgi:hypothetical protein